MTLTCPARSRGLIVGAGAIGSFYGAALQAGGADVALVCRSEYETVRQHGYEIRSQRISALAFIQVSRTAPGKVAP